MQTFGYQLLARTAFADHENGAVERGGAARALDGVEECQALTDELIRSLHSPTVGGKSHQLARIFALIPALKRRFLRNSALS